MDKEMIQNVIVVVVVVLCIHIFLLSSGILEKSVGFVVKKEAPVRVESTRVSQKTVSEPLKVRENSFSKNFRTGVFVLNLTNVDALPGKVTATVSCPGFSANQTKSAQPGEHFIFEFEEPPCDPEHTFIPELVTREK